MLTEPPNTRAYVIGLCYFCQTCLPCGIDCNYQTCKCKKEKVPINTRSGKRKLYAQTYQSNMNEKSVNLSKINKLKYSNNYYGYGKEDVTKNTSETIQVDIDQFSLLHIDDLEEETQINTNQTSLYESEEIQINSSASSTPTVTDDDDINSTDEIKFIEITFKLIIKAVDGKCNAAKWETIIVDNFQKFKSSLDKLIQEQFEDQIVLRGDYNVAYKQEKEVGQGTQLTNWKRFLTENERIGSQKKVLVILITMKRKLKKTGMRDSDDLAISTEKLAEKAINKKNKSSNQILKEKNINNTNAIVAQNIMELSSKWYCKEHNRSCYMHNTATLDDPPTLPLFSAAKNAKKRNNNNYSQNIQQNIPCNNNYSQNIQQNIPSTMQASNQFYPPTGFFLLYPGMFNQPYNNFPNSLPPQTSLPQQTNTLISLPSIYEFFENLKENYNECNFDKVESKFLQKEIDVLDILSLNDCDWQRLGVKFGIKSKIMREVEKYR
ncbi:unnamed protein product [Rhizophagus irregularis]|uniref:SAM domain-containing protein n=1 Tax=Rhizophagus irregularis TaxID=588596 RepID=A0A2N1N9S3_9GLOM|nr:hypothetical protein RhiirC2_779489 [Rhizophagus irregularis]CAB4401622.1 unnamed protein product [Rhizophagus irregularis]CAB5378033.1 unnamed protein product [Rhizophagus irregularis]